MTSGSLIRVLALAGALLPGVACFAEPAAAEEGIGPSSPSPSPPRGASTLTLKERSSGKAMDEQRVDDCKVPFAQRGDHHRSPDCLKR